MTENSTPDTTPVPPPKRRPARAMLRMILLGLVVLLGCFLIYVSTRPDDFAISRTTVLPAAPERVFAIVNDFHEWQEWSPWAKLDPNSKATFSGPDAGVGAEFAWNGNSDVGQGRMAIVESQPEKLIKIDLQFIQPMQAKNLTEFTFQPDDTGTRITWTMSGKNGFMGKLFSVLIDCDKMIGDKFEEGFGNMKTLLASKSDPT